MKTIAIVNQKGGVAKTTTTVNLGAGLARQGKKVLLIDADPQASLTDSLGYREEQTVTIANVMTNYLYDIEMANRYGIVKHKEGMYLLPANIELSGMEITLVNVVCRELVLKGYIESIKGGYDYILIDCPPSLGMLTINALAAANEVIIPVQTQYLSLKGLQLLLKSLAQIKKKINPSLKIKGILLTMINPRLKHTKEIENTLEEYYGDKLYIFNSKIPQSVKAAESSRQGVSLATLDHKSKISIVYEELVQEVLRNDDQI